jgi:lysophospholipid acyltransferase (LPLAT)-like uncharacterized protein
MQPNHQPRLYGARPVQLSGIAEEIARLALLHEHTSGHSAAGVRHLGRSRFTRTLDAFLAFIRRYLPPIHWVLIRLVALGLFIYLRWVAATAKLILHGSYRWPDIPSGSVLAIWHGSAPSLLAAVAMQRSSVSVQILIACDARGDCLAVLCRWLGFTVVRGDAEHGAWKALIKIAADVHQSASALIAVDGGAPAFVAKVGAVALSSAAQIPLIPIGADCRPAIFERYKWDTARNPVPFGRIAVVCGEPIMFPAVMDAASLEDARKQLQVSLDRVSSQARLAFDAYA